jgi:hypothetical protein
MHNRHSLAPNPQQRLSTKNLKNLRKHSQNVGVLGELAAGDPTGDLSLNAEMRWETMANAGYLTPIDRFFVRNHATTPRVDPATWRLRVEGPGVERTLELGYDDLTRLPGISVVRALGCAGNGRVFFEQEREVPGTPWRLGAIGVTEWAGVRLREILERAGLKFRDQVQGRLRVVRLHGRVCLNAHSMRVPPFSKRFVPFSILTCAATPTG